MYNAPTRVYSSKRRRCSVYSDDTVQFQTAQVFNGSDIFNKNGISILLYELEVFIINNISLRNPAITLSRILGMIFIVLCHIIQYYSFIPMSESLGQFFNCGVYIFLFITGYLYGGKLIQNFRKWYLKRFLVVSLPAIIISVVFIILLLILGENISVSSIVAYSLDLEGLLFFNWKLSVIFSEIPGLGHLWFTTIIMLCYLLIPLLQWISKRMKPSMWFLILYFLCGSIISILLSDIYLSIVFYILCWFFCWENQYSQQSRISFSSYFFNYICYNDCLRIIST